jgi:hypothetical protein
MCSRLAIDKNISTPMCRDFHSKSTFLFYLSSRAGRTSCYNNVCICSMPMISLGTPSFPNDELVYLVLNYQSEARLVRRRRCMRFSNDSVLLWNQLLQLLFLKKKSYCNYCSTDSRSGRKAKLVGQNGLVYERSRPKYYRIFFVFLRFGGYLFF